MSLKPSKALNQFLSHYQPSIKRLALKLRLIVIDELAPCFENIYDAYNALALGYGTSDRLGDAICHIAVYATHVNLGFNHGAALPDPKKILLGSGKQIRHITIKEMADVQKPEVRAYLRRARKQSKHNTPRSDRPEVISVVKSIYPVRRRPDGVHRS